MAQMLKTKHTFYNNLLIKLLEMTSRNFFMCVKAVPFVNIIAKI